MITDETAQRIKGKRILVTGGAGFIGSWIVKALLQHGASVVRVLDNLATGKIENLSEVMDNPAFQWMEGDIRHADTCQKATKNIDIVCHQAALGSVPRSFADPLTTHEVNITGFLNICVAAIDNGIQRLVYASSSSVYGDSLQLPKVEHTVGTPLSPYAVSKYANELYASVFAAKGLPAIGLRYFNVFGPNQDPNGPYAAVIPLFLKAASQGIPAIINGDGEQTRDFTYVENVVKANLLAMTSMNAGSLNQVYNIACSDRISINDLWRIISAISGNTIEVQHGTARTGDVRDSLADIDKAKQLLGYSPVVDVKEGLERTWRAFSLNR